MNRFSEPSTSTSGVGSPATLDITSPGKTEKSRSEGDERFRNLIESSLQGVVVHRNDRPLFANQAAADILGYDSPEDILRMNTIDECVAPHERERMKTYREARAWGEEAPEHYEFQVLRKDGTTSWAEIRSTIVDWGGEPAIQAVCNDITKRKQAELVLRESEERFRDFADTASDWFWETDAEHRLTNVSGDSEYHVEYWTEARVGRTRFDGRIPDDTDDAKWEAHRADLEARRSFKNFQFPARGADGAIHHVRISGKPNFSADGEFRGYRGMGSDITEFVEADERARSAQERLAVAIDGLSESFVLFDAEDRLVISNRTWRGFNLAIAEQSQPGARFQDILSAQIRVGLIPEASGQEEKWLSQRLERHRTPMGPFEVARPEGRWLLVNDHRLPDGAIITIATDITALKQTEHALRKSEERFRDFAESSSDWFWETDAEHRFSCVSEHKDPEVDGWNRSAVGKTRFELRVPDDRDDGKWKAHRSDLDARRPFRNFDYPREGAKGDKRYMRVSGMPVFSEDGAFEGYRGTASDITVQVNAETALRESETRAEQAHARLVDAIESLNEGFVLIDSDDRLVMTNKRFLELYAELAHLYTPGTTSEDIIRGIAASGLVSEARGREDEWVRERMEYHRNPGAPFERRLGPDLWMLSSERKTSDGGSVTVVTDITELKKREVEIQALNRDLEQRVAARTEQLSRQLEETEAAETALRASEGRLRSVMNSTIDGIIVTDEAGTIESFTRAAEKIFGYVSDEVVGQNVNMLMPEPDQGRHGGYIGRYMETGETKIIGVGREVTGLRKDGSTFPMDIGISEVDLGDRRSFTGIVRDITERKQAEQEIADKTTLLEATFESISEGFALYDSDDRLVFCNEIYRRLGGRVGDLIKPGVRFEDIIRANLEYGRIGYGEGDEEAKVQARLAHHLNPTGNLEVQLSDGRWLLFVERKTADGGIALVQTDITEKKQAEANIATSEERLQTILASSPCGVGVSRIDDGTIIYINERAAARVGLTPDEMVGSTVADNWVNSRDRDRFREILRRDGRVDGTAVELKRADGSRYWSLLSWEQIPMFGEDTVVFWSYDISELKEAQENMRLAKEEADAANRAKSEFLSRMSHELRTPMNAILGFGQILQADPEEPLGPNQGMAVDQILKSGEHLLELINEVLDLAVVESGNVTLTIEAIDPGSIIESCLSLAEPLADERGIDLVNGAAGKDLARVSADETRFRQALLNLISNAVKYNRDGGVVSVEAEETEDGMVRVGVADTGPGIPAERQNELFQPFSRLDAKKTEIEGTGIGLTISKQLVELMGGQIGFESAEGKGSIFWIELPLAAGTVTATGMSEASAATGSRADGR